MEIQLHAMRKPSGAKRVGWKEVQKDETKNKVPRASPTASTPHAVSSATITADLNALSKMEQAKKAHKATAKKAKTSMKASAAKPAAVAGQVFPKLHVVKAPGAVPKAPANLRSTPQEEDSVVQGMMAKIKAMRSGKTKPVSWSEVKKDEQKHTAPATPTAHELGDANSAAPKQLAPGGAATPAAAKSATKSASAPAHAAPPAASASTTQPAASAPAQAAPPAAASASASQPPAKHTSPFAMAKTTHHPAHPAHPAAKGAPTTANAKHAAKLSSAESNPPKVESMSAKKARLKKIVHYEEEAEVADMQDEFHKKEEKKETTADVEDAAMRLSTKVDKMDMPKPLDVAAIKADEAKRRASWKGKPMSEVKAAYDAAMKKAEVKVPPMQPFRIRVPKGGLYKAPKPTGAKAPQTAAAKPAAVEFSDKASPLTPDALPSKTAAAQKATAQAPAKARGPAKAATAAKEAAPKDNKAAPKDTKAAPATEVKPTAAAAQDSKAAPAPQAKPDAAAAPSGLTVKPSAHQPANAPSE